jgi:hypothetical protein
MKERKVKFIFAITKMIFSQKAPSSSRPLSEYVRNARVSTVGKLSLVAQEPEYSAFGGGEVTNLGIYRLIMMEQ